VYPPAAKEARVQGVVKMDVVIGPDGRVQSVVMLEGPAMLLQAAADAVQQWVYTPVQMNGQPTAVVTTVEVNFTLLN
jgi:periplasmic protein TonB